MRKSSKHLPLCSSGSLVKKHLKFNKLLTDFFIIRSCKQHPTGNKAVKFPNVQMEYFGAMYGKFTLKRLQRNGKIKVQN